MHVHIFRRDLRLEDNTALNAALSRGPVYACFILDPRQASDHEYHSTNALQFMFTSLRELNAELEKRGGILHVHTGEAEAIVAELLDVAASISFNADYTPFSRARDEKIAKHCVQRGIPCSAHHDALLNPPEAVIKDDGTPYSIFTPYFKAAGQRLVTEPKVCPKGDWIRNGPGFSLPGLAENPRIAVRGGRSEALAILDDLARLRNYGEIRDFPVEETTRLSAHNKFGTVSIREAYAAIRSTLGAFHPLVRQLYWRDFFTQIAYHFPHVFRGSFHQKFDRVDWDSHEQRLAAWKEGRTGFPIVDAGMRELRTTGYMHNRVRMIVASFLTKDLHIDWREGERHFARHLVDYDPAVNNGSWQWAASTGCDAAPYFRIFNPWLQQRRFDPACVYIKRWVPELASEEGERIHGLAGASIKGYPKPIVDHQEEKEVAIARFRAAI